MANRVVAVLSSHTPSLFWFRMDMMLEFRKRGWTVYAVANEAAELWEGRFEEQGIHYRQIQVQRNGMNILRDLRALRSIQDVLGRIRPHKIFAFQAKTIIYGTIAARRLGITEVYPLIAGVGSVFLKDDLKTRLVRKVLTTEYRAAMRDCPAVFFQNRDDEALFRGQKIIRRQPVVLLHGSGVSVEKFQVSQIPTPPVFLCVSRLIRDKGVGEYLEACRMLRRVHPDAHCLLVGPYDSNPSAIREAELAAYVEDGSVVYCGETEDVRPYLAESSVFVLPSYREGTPKSSLEAMACGRPIITTDVPGCRETVTDGENGFLVAPRSGAAVFEKMLWFMDHPEAMEPMGRKGRKRAEELFDVRIVNQTICETMGI